MEERLHKHDTIGALQYEFEFEAEPTAWVAAVPYPFGYTPRRIGTRDPPVVRVGQ